MVKTLLVVAAVLGLLLVAALIYAATRPDTFRVERSIRINAPAEQIIALVNDFRAMQTWSAWEKVDPAMKRSFSGPSSGKGAVYAWEGNSEIGQGRMEITEATPQKVTIKMDFIKPFAAQNTGELTLQTQGTTTTVTHAMYGPSPYIAKVMGLVFSMDRMVGGKFEQGLADLKVLAEKPPLSVR